MSAAPFEIQVDSSRNLLRAQFRGHVTPADMLACTAQLETSLRRLRPKFAIVTDLTELDSMDLDCVRSLTDMMELFKTNDVGTVVRVIPDPEKDIGFNLLSIVHYRQRVKIATCQTRDQAEQILSAE